VGHSATLVAAVTGGVLPRALRTMPGTAAWIPTVAMYTGKVPISRMGSLFVASGINLFDSFDNLII